MSWCGIEGHDALVEQFRRALARGRLASTFLFVGPAGIGKRAFADRLVQGLFCQEHPPAALDPCGACPACRQVASASHPDLNVVEKPVDREEIPIALLVGDVEHRKRQGLCHWIGLKPFLAARKVAILDDADHLNEEGTNCLLKTLEEPPPRSLLILVGTSPARQLPTVRSRCQIVRFRPLAEEAVVRLLVEQQGLTTAEARAAAETAGGSVGRALAVAGGEWESFRSRLYSELSSGRFNSVRLAAETVAFIEAAGSEGSRRRVRLRQAAFVAADFYRRLLARLAAADGGREAPWLDAALQRWPADTAAAADCLDRCLAAAEQSERYIPHASLVETWMDDLVRLATRSA